MMFSWASELLRGTWWRRIPYDPLVHAAVQKFVRDWRLTHTRAVAKDVAAFLRESNHIEYDADNPKAVESAVRWISNDLDFNEGRKRVWSRLPWPPKTDYNGISTLFSCAAKFDMLAKWTVVYLDESYIHKNYSQLNDSLFDPNKSLHMQVKAQHKGQWYCFIMAIADGGERGSFLCAKGIFVGGKQKDYHAMFDHAYFVNWFGKLLDEWHAWGVHNAIIAVDNAKYHEVLLDGTPRKGKKKANLQAACVK